MPDKPLQLEGSISSSDVMVGRGQLNRNKIVVKLVNIGGQDLELSGRGEEGTLLLTASVGNRPEDFVANLEVASGVKIESAARWQQVPYKTSPGQITWSFLLSDKILNAKAETFITLTGFECETDPGKAKLALAVAITGYADYKTTLTVEKKDPSDLQILYFEANPPVVITKEDSAAFKLEWNTIKAHTVSLFKGNVSILTLTEGEENSFKNKQRFTFSTAASSFTAAPSFTVVYKLVAMDKVDPVNIKQEKEITVHVLERGWRRLENFGAGLGYPSVLCNLDGLKLYGIWIKNGKAQLYSSTHPWAAWAPEKGIVPEKMSTSPAVSFSNRLWLVGGSATDTRVCSNHVWSYGSEGWVQQKDAEWKPRMGHACVVALNRIWVLGGILEDGNSLNEVWSFDRKGNWTRHREAPWSKRCMQAATNFPAMILEKGVVVPEDRIWVYGGVTEPFGDPLDDMWRSRDGENWERYTSVPEDSNKKPIGKPVGCALQVLNGKLHLLGTFRSGTLTPSIQCVLEEAQRTWQTSPVLVDRSWHQQGGNTFNLSSVEFKGLIFVRSLDHETADNPTALNMFAP
jgi:hypothetical protein